MNRFIDVLVNSRLNGTPVSGLDPAALPATLDDGYGVQDKLHRQLTEAGLGRRCGWKIGCTTAVMQQYLKIDSPCAGGLFSTAVLQSPARVRFGDYAAPGVECEIAVRLGADLARAASAHDRHSVAGAVAQVHAAIEIVDQRLADWCDLATPVLVADDFFQAGAVIGPPADFDPAMDLAAVRGELTVNGKIIGSGLGADVMGHPLDALAWLANQRLAQGYGLRQGDLVLTGSVVQTHWVDAGDSVVARIAGLGDARVTFTN
jgi:2-oxo-3-hexenedioate decarboxylase/2-keto-4-pentenoate hydratase